LGEAWRGTGIALEWQVVGTVALTRSWWERSLRATGSRSSALSWICGRSWLASLSGIGIDAADIPCTDIVEPTALILVGIYVEADKKLFASLYVELLDFVLTEDVENALAWVLVVSFNDIVLCHPLVAGRLRHTTARWENRDNLSLNFHIV